MSGTLSHLHSREKFWIDFSLLLYDEPTCIRKQGRKTLNRAMLPLELTPLNRPEVASSRPQLAGSVMERSRCLLKLLTKERERALRLPHLIPGPQPFG